MKESFDKFALVYGGKDSDIYKRSLFYCRGIFETVQLSHSDYDKLNYRHKCYLILDCYLTLCKHLDRSHSIYWVLELMTHNEEEYATMYDFIKSLEDSIDLASIS